MSAEQNVVEAPAEHRSAQGTGESFGQEAGGQYEMDENGQRVPHGMGQSKSSRRRRRKRKKGAEGGDGPEQGHAGGASDGEIPSIQASATPTPAQQRPQGQQQRTFQQGGQNSNGQQNNGSAPGGTKRWKKKFRDRDRGPRTNDNPGNQQSAAASARVTTAAARSSSAARTRISPATAEASSGRVALAGGAEAEASSSADHAASSDRWTIAIAR